MTTCIMTFMTNNIGTLYYIFIDEFSFLSYWHLKNIVDQIMVVVGEHAKKGKSFGGMHFIFFDDYEQLSKPDNYAMYYGA